ncbi:hypothetical protein GCM10009765_04770 [Fodinicola feengrottensis]|uniref:Alpha/beta hydrolase fold-3 domain-containing protein n=1 Tax=Fodinicola feengrottensis TaxID=435914 RepID=A0ABP4RRJ9_9ACTN
MTSKEWSELRETFAACAPTAMAATTAAVMAVDPAIDLGGADRFHALTKEPADVTYEELTAAGLPAIWANPNECDSEAVLVYFHGGASSAARRKATGKSPRIWPRRRAFVR